MSKNRTIYTTAQLQGMKYNTINDTKKTVKDTIDGSAGWNELHENNVNNISSTGKDVIYETGADNIYSNTSHNTNYIGGTNGNDWLKGDAGNNILDGKAGADIMSGGAGDDYYIVDKYETLITNANGTVTLQSGDQVIEGFLNNNFIYGDSGGNDTIEQWDDHRFYRQDNNGNWIDTGSYHPLQTNIENLILKGNAKTAFGNELDNTITLNEQNNFVNGLGGNDTIIYTKGGGQDSISVTDNITAVDTLIIEGYKNSETFFTKEQNSLLIRFSNSDDHIWINDYFLGARTTNAVTTDNKVDRIIFRNNGQEVVITKNDIDNATIDRSDNHAPTVNKYPKNIIVEDNDTINFKLDKDNITDQDSWDNKLTYSITTVDRQPLPNWLTFDPETLTLSGTPNPSQIGTHQFIIWGTDLFGSGVGTYINITINASTDNPDTGPDLSGDNIIKDTLGNDYLKGGAGNDTYIYTAGQDVLTDTQGIDKLIFSNGITFNQVGSGLIMSGNDLILRVNGSSSNQIKITNFFSDYDSIIETIEFETGGSISHTQIFNLFGISIPKDNSTTDPKPIITGENDLIGTEANDNLKGSANSDRLQGLSGDDILDGQAGNDIIVAGKGNDILIGGEGNDLYYIKSGFGNDTIINIGGGIDNIYFDGLNFNDIASGLQKAGNNLILNVRNSTDSLTLKDFFTGGENAELNISFKSGSYSIQAEQLLNAFGLSNPDASHVHSQAEYQSTLSTMLGLMDQFNSIASSDSSVI